METTPVATTNVENISVVSIGSDKSDGSSSTPTVTASSASSTSAVQIASATVDRTSAAPVLGYILSAAATIGASGSRTAEVQSETSILARADESGKATVKTAEALSGGTADGTADVDALSASLPPSPARLDLPAPRDVAASLVGAQPRADVLPQKGGRLSVVATAVAGADPVAGKAQEGHLRDDLFVGPLNASLAAADLPLTEEGAPLGFALPDEPATGFNWTMHGIAVATVGLAAAAVWGMQRQRTREEEGKDLVRP
jgi:hypothetical protein